MAGFIKGDVIVVPFPFSDLSANKRRPALVVADLPGDDMLLCQSTSQQSTYSDSIQITATDFISGGLPLVFYVRPNRIFTADKNIIRRAGTLTVSVVDITIQKIISLLEQ